MPRVFSQGDAPVKGAFAVRAAPISDDLETNRVKPA